MEVRIMPLELPIILKEKTTMQRVNIIKGKVSGISCMGITIV